MKQKLGYLSLILLCLVMCTSSEPANAGQGEKSDFVDLFDGETLSGWRKLTSYSGEAGKWEVVGGAIVGDQFPPGEGGLLVTEALYGDYELLAEVKADYPIDSGLFLRVQPDVLSYQVTIDYRPDGEVGAIYCPGGGGFLVHKPEGEKLWKPDEFNTVRVRIEGQPAHIQVWINGTALVDFTDELQDDKPRVPATGHVGIQVHPGSSWGEGKLVHFRRVAIRPLD